MYGDPNPSSQRVGGGSVVVVSAASFAAGAGDDWVRSCCSTLLETIVEARDVTMVSICAVLWTQFPAALQLLDFFCAGVVCRLLLPNTQFTHATLR
jgi:hypothetical protein